MANTQRVGFINNVSEEEILHALNTMESSPSYSTKPTYRGDAIKWPNNQISFVDFHVSYLKAHTALNPHHYLANLRLVLKKR